jgi:hypothetical protein
VALIVTANGRRTARQGAVDETISEREAA